MTLVPFFPRLHKTVATNFATFHTFEACVGLTKPRRLPLVGCGVETSFLYPLVLKYIAYTLSLLFFPLSSDF